MDGHWQQHLIKTARSVIYIVVVHNICLQLVLYDGLAAPDDKTTSLQSSDYHQPSTPAYVMLDLVLVIFVCGLNGLVELHRC